MCILADAPEISADNRMVRFLPALLRAKQLSCLVKGGKQ
jgi:hypothetical protein